MHFNLQSVTSIPFHSIAPLGYDNNRVCNHLGNTSFGTLPVALWKLKTMRRIPAALRGPSRRNASTDEKMLSQAISYHQVGRLDQAKELYQTLLRHNPRNTKLRSMLGTLHLQFGDHREAAAELKKAIDGGFRDAATYNSYALALSGQARHDQAIDAARNATELKPEMPELLINLGNILHKAGSSQKALECYRRAIRLDRDLPSAYVGMGNSLAALGDLDSAICNFRRALEINPHYTKAFYNLALTSKVADNVADTAMIEKFEHHAASGVLSEDDAIMCYNALGFLADRANDYPRAFEHFRKFNELVLEKRRREGRSFDRVAHSAFIDRIIETFSASYFRERVVLGSKSRRPVFIIGMPRSGTTLVEQIVARHHSVAPGGELPNIPILSNSICGYPLSARNISKKYIRRMAHEYLAALCKIDSEAGRVTDKTPTNFLDLGLIVTLFPNATVIHCRRKPLDICLSCYCHNFSSRFNFSNHLEDLGAYYKDYLRLMEHWNKVLPRRPVDVCYEKLVSDPDQQIRKLVDSMGLEWNSKCLNLDNSKTAVLTSSQLQVRQKISTSSVDRWRRYEDQLTSLYTALGGLQIRHEL